MSNINDSGPAFPIIGTHEEVLGIGISVRDYFAAKALEGFCSSPHVNIEWLREHCATSCYQMADAMLKARQS